MIDTTATLAVILFGKLSKKSVNMLDLASYQSGNPLNMVVVILQKGTLYAMCVRCQLFWEKIGYSGRFCDLGRFGDSCRIGKVIKIVEAGGSALRPPYYCGVLID